LRVISVTSSAAPGATSSTARSRKPAPPPDVDSSARRVTTSGPNEISPIGPRPRRRPVREQSRLEHAVVDARDQAAARHGAAAEQVERDPEPEAEVAMHGNADAGGRRQRAAGRVAREQLGVTDAGLAADVSERQRARRRDGPNASTASAPSVVMLRVREVMCG
jgi:hypothetical protein